MYMLGFIIANIFGGMMFVASFALVALAAWGGPKPWEQVLLFCIPMSISVTVFYFTWSKVTIDMNQ